jgi:Uma2 family endonuclease
MANVALSDPARFGGRALPGQNDLPFEDGEPLESWFHVTQLAVLADPLHDAWRDRRDFFLGENMFVYFSEQQVRTNDFRGPDVFVVLDVERKIRKSWVAWDEGGKLPDVVIEVTSDSTAHVDRGEKMRIYSKIWRTPAYFIFDPDTRVLEGYRLGDGGRDYVAIEPNAHGDLPVAPLGLALGVRRTRYRDFDEFFLRWIDEHGEPLPIPAERTERALAEAEERRIEAGRTRAEAERARAEAERARAEADEQRARAEEALARVRDLEARLEKP